MSSNHIAFYLPNLNGGGAERVTLNLIKGLLKKDYEIDLVLSEAMGAFLQDIPPEVKIYNLDQKHQWQCIYPLVKYLRARQPHVFISNLRHANIAALLAQWLSFASARVIAVEHNAINSQQEMGWKTKLLPKIMKYIYPSACKVIGVSDGVTNDLIRILGLSPTNTQTIYNPVVQNRIFTLMQEAVSHPWLQNKKTPVFLAIGRLTEQKNFGLLVKAFSVAKRSINISVIATKYISFLAISPSFSEKF